MSTRSCLYTFIALCAAISASLASAQAQTAYPTRPIKIVTGWTAGSQTDSVTRLIAQPLSERLGQPIIVENKPGAGGDIGASTVAKAPPDGYTLLVLTGGHAALAASKKTGAYDPVNDLAWITTLATYPIVYLTLPTAPFTTMRDLVERSKADPKRYSYGTTGVGTVVHLATVAMVDGSGGSMLHVPLNSTQLVTELLGGRVDVIVTNPGSALPLIKSNRARALAVTSESRWPLMPDVPTVGESKFDMVFDSWVGLAAPRGTPPAVLDRLHRELGAILADPAIQKKLSDIGSMVKFESPSEFKNRVANEIRTYSTVIKNYSITVE